MLFNLVAIISIIYYESVCALHAPSAGRYGVFINHICAEWLFYLIAIVNMITCNNESQFYDSTIEIQSMHSSATEYSNNGIKNAVKMIENKSAYSLVWLEHK